MTVGEIDSTQPSLALGVYEESNVDIDKEHTKASNIINEAEANVDPELENQEQPQKREVPDGGYGWFIVLGCFISHVIIGSLERSDGIFFLQFQDRFGLSAQVTAWPGALVSTLRLAFGPVASILCNRYSVRTACSIGSILTFFGLFLDGHASSFYFLFLSHFFIQGIGRGLVYGPGLFLVGQYFHKKRGIATGLSTSGVGVGTFLLVPVSQMLFESYGYQGAFMVIAAISLHLYLCAMLYRPLSLHYRFTDSKLGKNAEYLFVRKSLVNENAKENSNATNIASWKTDDQCGREACSSNLHNDNAIDKDYLQKLHSSHPKRDGCLKSSLKICFPVDTHNRTGNNKKLFHFYLLRNPSFFIFCCSIVLFTAAFKSAFTFIPAQVKSLGYSESEAAMVLSITGVVDTFGRIGFGLVFDMNVFKCRRLLLYTAIVFCIAAVSFILPNLEDYVAICITCGCYGLLTGGFISQKSVVIVDAVGPENSANSFGLLICFQSIGMLVGPPVSGSLKDATGSFNLAFEVGGAMMLCSGCLMIVSYIFLRRQR